VLSDKQKRKLLRIALLLGKAILRVVATKFGIDINEVIIAVDDINKELT